MQDLEWAGIAWDGAVVRQSERFAMYAGVLDRLKGMELVYPCFCTRADIAASASAPHGPEGRLYPGTCRALPEAERAARREVEAHAWRIDMARAVGRTGPLWWQDERLGRVVADPLAAGDVVLARKDAPTSYHLAATVDDAEMGTTLVVRGRDLVVATHIHRVLQRLLGFPTPLYKHHALLVGPDGKRLAKRTGGLSLAELREAGMDPVRLAADLRAGVFPVGISHGDA